MAKLKITSFNAENKIIHLRGNLHRYSAKLKDVKKIYSDGSIGIELESGKQIKCNTIVPVEKLMQKTKKDYRTIRLNGDPREVRLYSTKDIAFKLHVAESTLRRWTDREIENLGYIRIGYLNGVTIYADLH